MPDSCGFCGIESVPDQHALRSARVAELLRQNGPPLDAEKPALLAAITDGPARLADLEKMIAEAQQVLGGLLRERELVKVQLADAKDSAPPYSLTFRRSIPRDIFVVCLRLGRSQGIVRVSICRVPRSPETSLDVDPRQPQMARCRSIFSTIMVYSHIRFIPILGAQSY